MENKGAIGKITQVISAVLDIKFPEGHLPEINDAIRIPLKKGGELIVEGAQHLGDDTVRCIALGPTDGLVRGMDAIATGGPISVPVGEKTLGRLFNVLGEPIDEIAPPQTKEHWPIHRKAPSFEEQATSQEMLETGIKVVLCKGRQDRPVRRRRRRQDRADPGTDPQHCHRAWWIFGIYRSRRAYP